MLAKIKSIFFVKILLTKVKEGIKLDLIKYNKYIQNLIDININNYKIFSGKYIIYENNGKGKEYNSYNDELLFEGEYSNGKRHGKGKEYDENLEIIFEGEYSNGKRNGKGIEYYSDGNILFEGEYLNGKRWNGIGYDGNNNFAFEIKNGNGSVKEFYFLKLKKELN